MGKMRAAAVVFLMVIAAAGTLASCASKTSPEAIEKLKQYANGLDEPFQFLLHDRGYALVAGEHDADTVSSWGVLRFQRIGAASTRDRAAESLRALAAQAGWQTSEAPVDVVNVELARYGIAASDPGIRLTRADPVRTGHAPTRYSYQIWISPDASSVVAAFRVDAN